MEDTTLHARRRYRLVPNRQQIPNLPPIDPSLWLIHYYRAPPEHQLPARNLPINDQSRHLISERNSLQSHGQLQLQHKEFMLRDRENWPTINLPGNTAPGYVQQAMGYPNNVMAHLSRSQHSAYMQNSQAAASQAAVGPSPAKRPRHTSSHGHVSATAVPMPIMPPDGSFDDEETTSGIDYMDVLTPQEISNQRYRQHHEWLEEILNSPYDTRQIVPGELGLGRKGELESLTRDFFDAHTKARASLELELPAIPKESDYREGRAVVKDDPPPRVGRLEPGKAEAFEKRAVQRMAELHSEMEKLNRQHARRMAKLRKGNFWRDATQNLRAATSDLINENTSNKGSLHDEHIDQLTKTVEQHLGRQIRALPEVECIEKGGLEEKIEANFDENFDIEMNDPMAHVNGTSEPALSGPTNLIPAQSPNSTPANTTPQPPQTQITSPHTPSAQESSAPPETKDDAPDDWVMVNKDTERAAQNDQAEGTMADSTEVEMATADDSGIPDISGPANNELTFEDTDFDTGLVDFDTAGDELSGYAQEIENMGAKDEQALSMQEDLINRDSPHQDLFPISGGHSESAS